MWVDRSGRNLTAEQVCSELARRCGTSYTVESLHNAFRAGAICRNGGVWFQRVE